LITNSTTIIPLLVINKIDFENIFVEGNSNEEQKLD
jgi:hypothetical protein